MKARYIGSHLILQVSESDLKYYNDWRNTGGAFNVDVSGAIEDFSSSSKRTMPARLKELIDITQRFEHNGYVTIIMQPLVDLLTSEQLEAVIYHEIGHAAMKHSQREGMTEVERELEADAFSVQFTSKKAMREALNLSVAMRCQEYAHKARFVESLYEIAFNYSVTKERLKALED